MRCSSEAFVDSGITALTSASMGFSCALGHVCSERYQPSFHGKHSQDFPHRVVNRRLQGRSEMARYSAG